MDTATCLIECYWMMMLVLCCRVDPLGAANPIIHTLSAKRRFIVRYFKYGERKKFAEKERVRESSFSFPKWT